MRSLEKRLQEIEQANKPKEEKPAAHVAIIKTDGSVTVQRPNNSGSFQLPNEAALEQWVKDNQVSESDYLKVIIVNSQGREPKEI